MGRGKIENLDENTKIPFNNWQLFMINGEPYEYNNLPLVKAIKNKEVIREEFIIKRQGGADHICEAVACPVIENDIIIGGMIIFLTGIKRFGVYI